MERLKVLIQYKSSIYKLPIPCKGMVDMVEANSVIPLYKQIVRALSDLIANGTGR